MDTSSFSDAPQAFPDAEQLSVNSSTSDCYRVKIYGKLHFLKRLRAELRSDPRYIAALQKEFETGYSLEHPHLVRYLSRGDDYLMTEYVDGETLGDFAKSHPDYFRSRKNTDRLLLQLLDVVGYLHLHQIVHLDLKPDNIIITRIGNDVKLMDLGYCYSDSYTDTTGRTDKYAAPEQLKNLPVDVRTDIYAIGRILQTLPCAARYKKVIARCTAPNPASRYQDIGEVMRALKDRHPYMVVAAVVLVLLAMTALLFLQKKSSQEADIQTTAQVENDSTDLAEREQDTLEGKPIIVEKNLHVEEIETPQPEIVSTTSQKPNEKNQNPEEPSTPKPTNIIPTKQQPTNKNQQPETVAKPQLEKVTSIPKQNTEKVTTTEVGESSNVASNKKDVAQLRSEIEKAIRPSFDKYLATYLHVDKSEMTFAEIEEFGSKSADFEGALVAVYHNLWEKHKNQYSKNEFYEVWDEVENGYIDRLFHP